MGFWLFNGSLLLFWLCLVGAGMVKGYYTVLSDLHFQVIMERIRPFIVGFAISGVGLFVGLSMLVWDGIQALLNLPNSLEDLAAHHAIDTELPRSPASVNGRAVHQGSSTTARP
ncbi:MAG: hypothetical protein IPO56_08350 [Flavobacteriales bacterium]|nr:hypothetical protein [Flavobacteriales bacterium]